MTLAAIDTETGELVGLPQDSTPGVRIADVIVGERARKDYGDLSDLMESIRRHGLLQPIGVIEGNRLLFGGRRLEACRRLGWTAIPFTRPHTQDHALALLQAERDENTCRKPMTLSELVELGRRIEEMERPAALEQQRAGLLQGATPRGAQPRATGGATKGDTRRKVDKALGVSGGTFERAKHVLDVAADPAAPEAVREVAREAAKQMDATGGAWSAYKKVKEAEAAAATTPSAPPPATDKSRAAIAARVQMARDLATTGRTSRQIAEAIGMSEESAREMFRREGITVHADKAIGKTRRLDANRVIEQTVRAAEVSPELLAAINYGDLDRNNLGEWVSSLSESLKALRSLKTTLEKELSRVTE